MKKFFKFILNRLGFDIVKINKCKNINDFFCDYSKRNNKFVDVEKLSEISLTIPGMITPESGKFLYLLCYMQELNGDVLEVGSWQGRSTSFLARAVEKSNNGKFFAVDHFCGNKGKEDLYRIKGNLSNLKENFNNNISTLKLDKVVNLLDMQNTEAAKIIDDNSLRFLFIDGDHTKEGVEKDIELFFPKLLKGAIVVFDDYFAGFPGLIEAIEEKIPEDIISKVFYYRHTLVLKIR